MAIMEDQKHTGFDHTSDTMQRRRRVNPKQDAQFYVGAERDKVGFDVRFISPFKGRGIFTTTPFEKGDFLLEYRGELISKQECEKRQRLYHKKLKAFMFEFYFNGKLWCVDAAKEDGSFGRIINDNHVNPNAKMKYLTVEGKPHLCLFATRDISPGEEVTYNYGKSDWPWRSKESAEGSSENHGVLSHTSEPSTSAHKTPIGIGQWQIKTTSAARHRSYKMVAEGNQTEIDGTNQTEMDDCNQSLTKPVYDPLSQDEKIKTESNQPELDDGNKIFTNPVRGPLTQDEKGATKNENQFIRSSEMDPVDLSEKCQKHLLVCTTISSLDKCIQCVGPISSLSWIGYKCKDEIVFSDTEENQSENESDDGDTEVIKTEECGTSEPVDAASQSTVTEQVHSTGDFETVSTVASTMNETIPGYEGQDAGPTSNNEGRRTPKKTWSKAEINAVMKYFKVHIAKGKLATKTECAHCKLVEGSVLEQRTVQNIRDFVRNRGVAAKKLSRKQNL